MLNSLSRRSRFDICAIRARTLWCSCSFMNRNDSASCPTLSGRRRGRHATDGGTRIGSVRSWLKLASVVAQLRQRPGDAHRHHPCQHQPGQQGGGEDQPGGAPGSVPGRSGPARERHR